MGGALGLYRLRRFKWHAGISQHSFVAIHLTFFFSLAVQQQRSIMAAIKANIGFLPWNG